MNRPPLKHLLQVIIPLLALVPSYGGVIYSGEQSIAIGRADYRVDSPYVYPHNDALNLDLTGDGQVDFSFFTHAPVPVLPTFVLFGARGLNDGYYSGYSSSVLNTYTAGQTIGSGEQWTSDIDLPPPSGDERWWGQNFFGYVSGEGYLGFKVRSGDDFRFGWIGYSIPAGSDSSLTITGWAFETDAGAPIAAGAKGIAAVPDHGPSIVVGLAFFMMTVFRRLYGAKQRP